MKRQDLPSEEKYDNRISVILLGAMFVFTIGTYTIETFMSSLKVEAVYLIVTVFILLMHYTITKTKITIYRIEIFWFVFLLYFLFNIVFQGKFIKEYYVDILAFGFIFLFLLLAKINIKYFIISIRIMLIFSILYAFSVLFQYFNMDLYSKIILPRFTDYETEELLRLYRRGDLTGFSWQTAYIAGYMVYGIGIAILGLKKIKIKLFRIVVLLSLPIMGYSLFLANKRAHLLFMITALILTLLFSTETKRFSIQLLKIGTSIFIGATIIMLLLSSNRTISESPVGNIFNNITETVEGVSTGQDITSGRIYLYEYAIDLFKEKPIFGIGWRKYSELSVGVINVDRGSHPHNIYLQLLTELGLIGFILFMIPIILFLVKTINLLMNYNRYFEGNPYWDFVLKFSLYVQFFFLLYGLTGNLLTDRLFLLMYVFAISIIPSAIKYVKKV